MRTAVSGRGWAYVGAGLGGAVSIAANVAHSYVPPVDAPGAWSPPVGAVVASIFWPIALFVAVEILARVAWPDGKHWAVLRYGGLLPVALVAAFVSYKHLSGLIAFYGEDRLTAMLGPLAVDGLMVVATGALIATSTRKPAADPVGDGAEPPVDTSARGSDVSPVKRVMPKPASVDKVAKAAAKLPGASIAAIAAKAGVSESTARRHLTALGVTVASPTAPEPAETPLNEAA